MTAKTLESLLAQVVSEQDRAIITLAIKHLVGVHQLLGAGLQILRLDESRADTEMQAAMDAINCGEPVSERLGPLLGDTPKLLKEALARSGVPEIPAEVLVEESTKSAQALKRYFGKR